MYAVTTRIKAILLLCGIAFGLSACVVYDPAPYYASPGYSYYPPAGYGYYGAPAYGYYAPSVVIGGGEWRGGGGHHWR